MSGSIVEDIKSFLYSGNMINKLIVVNLLLGLVFVFSMLVSGYKAFEPNIVKYFLLSSDLIIDLYHPWTLITHLFLSFGILHFIINMLFLYWFGNIIGDMVGDSKILPLYILSGLSGAFVYILCSYFFTGNSITYINGVDSVILGFAIASAFLVPDFSINLILIGRVRLKVLAAIFVIIEFLYSISSYNTVYFSYIGAGFFGWFYIYSMKRGNDISKPFNLFFDKLINVFSFNKTKQINNLSVRYKSKKSGHINSLNKRGHNDELNRILEKIKKTGYDSLTEEEKEFLFLASKKE